MPQGLPWSPLLAIVALNHIFKKIGLTDVVMYADDGILITRDPRQFELLSHPYLQKCGVYLSEKVKDEKPVCGEVEEIFTFLGMTYNFKKDLIHLEGPKTVTKYFGVPV